MKFRTGPRDGALRLGIGWGSLPVVWLKFFQLR